MEVIIKSLSPEACDDIDEVFGQDWRLERSEFYEYGVKMYDVAVNFNYVTIETDKDGDGVWVRGASEKVFLCDAAEFLAIVIR